MILNIYSIKDSKAGTFSQPYYAHNDLVAERSFDQASADPTTTISQYPSDYSLYRLGSYDDNSGEITSEAPVFIANAKLKEVKQDA